MVALQIDNKIVRLATEDQLEAKVQALQTAEKTLYTICQDTSHNLQDLQRQIKTVKDDVASIKKSVEQVLELLTNSSR